MAKYHVLMSCGHEDVLELRGKTAERARKIEYFKSYGICKACYKKKMREQEEQQDLIFNATVLPYIDPDDGSLLISVWFSGNTMPFKDDIKSLGGYYWDKRISANDWYSFAPAPKCWNKEIKPEELEMETIKAVSIGAKHTIMEKDLFATAHYHIALKKQKDWYEKQEKINAIEKPKVPTVLKGHKWNQKIYGEPGSYTVYPDGIKTSITDDEAAEIKTYLEAKTEYKKKVEEIKAGGI